MLRQLLQAPLRQFIAPRGVTLLPFFQHIKNNACVIVVVKWAHTQQIFVHLASQPDASQASDGLQKQSYLFGVAAVPSKRWQAKLLEPCATPQRCNQRRI
jgi:hypothetical protein